jgi:hypothetical protein
MTRTATNWASALLIALLLSTSYLLDGPDDIATEATVALEVADAQAQAIQTAQVRP